DVVHRRHGEIGARPVADAARLNDISGPWIGVGHERRVPERIVHVMAGQADPRRGGLPGDIAAGAALALLTYAAGRARRAGRAAIRVALGAIADVLGKEDLVQVDQRVAEPDHLELAG